MPTAMFVAARTQDKAQSDMFAIVVPGKVGALNVRFPSAAEALRKYREMEADGLTMIDLRDGKGDEISPSDLEHRAAAEAAEDPGSM